MIKSTKIEISKKNLLIIAPSGDNYCSPISTCIPVFLQNINTLKLDGSTHALFNLLFSSKNI